MAVVTFNSAGSGVWLCPSGVTSVKVECWGGGGGAQRGTGTGGTGGGGAEYASEATVAVTPGRQYAWTVGAAGQGATPSGDSTSGGLSSFAGDTLTVTANGGRRGGAGGQGGTGSTSTVHHDGGSGGSGFGAGAGGGGGSSAGTSAAGGNGGNGGAITGGAGGSPPAGGAAGGQGAPVLIDSAGAPGSAPGGGGGGGVASTSHLPPSGFPGAAGQVQLTYTGAFQPQVPYFPAGFAPLNSDFDNWIQAPFAFLTRGIVFRAELTTPLALPNNTATVIPFNSILEDPFSGWQAGSSQWLCPGGQSGVYEVSVTVSCAANASKPVVSARVGVDSSTFVYAVDKAWVPNVTVPGIASGAIPVRLYGGQDSVQAVGFLVGASGSVSTASGTRCRMSIRLTSE